MGMIINDLVIALCVGFFILGIKLILSARSNSKTISLEKRIELLTKSLNESVSVIDQIQLEIEERQELVKKLKRDADIYSEVYKLKKNEVDAVSQLLREEILRNNKKTQLEGFFQNLLFFIIGSIVSLIIALYI